MRIFEDPNFSFIPNRRKAYIFSGILLTLSLLSLFTRGVELGIDFQGGTELVVENVGDLDVVDVRGAVGEALGADPEVKSFGQTGMLIRTSVPGEIADIEREVIGAISDNFQAADPTIVKTDVVGPRFAEDLKRGAIYAVIFSLLIIFIYILVRFGKLFPITLENVAFPLGAVAALFHDVTITLGLFSLLNGVVPFSLQVDQTIIAAFLTIVGYSLNDTVVVFDRVREYTNLLKAERYPVIVNRSINSTLSRTLVTSGTTLLVVVTLFIFGGEVLKGFSFALIIGILIGTYSSVFVASPIVVELQSRKAKAVA